MQPLPPQHSIPQNSGKTTLLLVLTPMEALCTILWGRILLHMFKTLFDWCGVSYERVLEMQRTTFLLDLQMLLERDQLRARVR